MQLRTGDITLLGEESGGLRFFSHLKEQLDGIFFPHFTVHYYFFAETLDTNATSPQWRGTVFGEPPKAFAFLSGVFGDDSTVGNYDAGRRPHVALSGSPQRVSFINNLDVKATIYHQMNADMVVTTGSSFPLVALTVSPKVSMLLSPLPSQTYVPRTTETVLHSCLCIVNHPPAHRALWATKGGRFLPNAASGRLCIGGR